MIKLMDASDRLSVQVHPDDGMAMELGVGPRGKTECWLVLKDGGELFLGTRPGVDRAAFEAACSAGHVAEILNRFETKHGDFFFVPARTVHALGKGCLVYEIQQTCDVTFRVDDWGRVGLDGKPRALHLAESLATINFEAKGSWPTAAAEMPHRSGGTVRHLEQSDYFTVEERRASHTTTGGGDGRCSIVICVEGTGLLATAGSSCEMQPMRTYLVPAVAGAWTATVASDTTPFPPAAPRGPTGDRGCDRGRTRIGDSEDTVPIPVDKRLQNMSVLSVAPLLGEATRRIHAGKSVSSLFDVTE